MVKIIVGKICKSVNLNSESPSLEYCEAKVWNPNTETESILGHSNYIPMQIDI